MLRSNGSTGANLFAPRLAPNAAVADIHFKRGDA